MAKDDYYIIVYKILLYFYAVLRRKVVFNELAFNKAISKNKIDERYFHDVIRMMKEQGYIKNVSFIKAWGNEYIMTSAISDIEITELGIEFLTQNKKMEKIKNYLIESLDIVSSLINLLKI